MKKVLLLISLAMALVSGIAFSNPAFDDSVQTNETVVTFNYQQLLNRPSQTNEVYTKLFGNKEGSMMKVNMYCGFKPFPPLGCQVGACVCDQNGNNCQWTFVCR
jgi:hypothetical protein